jgi:hypothetical protein
MNRGNKQVVKRIRDGPAALLEAACGALRNITANNDNRVKCGAAVRAVIPHWLGLPRCQHGRVA